MPKWMSTSPPRRASSTATRTGVRYTPQAKHSGAKTFMRMSARPIAALPLTAKPAQRITPSTNIVRPTLHAATQSIVARTEMRLLRSHSKLVQLHSSSLQLGLLPRLHHRRRPSWTLTSMPTSPHQLLTSTNSELRCARTSSSTANVDMVTSVHSLIPANTSWSKPRSPSFTRPNLATTTPKPDTAPME